LNYILYKKLNQVFYCLNYEHWILFEKKTAIWTVSEEMLVTLFVPVLDIGYTVIKA